MVFHASDSVFLGMCKLMVDICRQGIDSNLDCFSILNFLNDVIDIYSPKRYTNISELDEEIKSSSVPKSFFRDVCLNLNFNNVDELIDFIESTKDLFDCPNDILTNSVNGPTSITPDSYLGVYIRSKLLDWHSMTFDEISKLFESTVDFLSNPISLTVKVHRLCNSKNVLDNINRSVMEGDVNMGESNIHKYYDFSDTFSLSSSPLDIARNKLESSEIINNKNHQQMMLTFSSFWLQNCYYSKALDSINEAMKLAHKRSDHISIAHALLLFHHIADQRPAACSEDILCKLEVSAEDALVRCLGRSLPLQLHTLSSQAALLLARWRMRHVSAMLGPSSNSLLPQHSFRREGATETRFDTGAESSVQELWSLLLAARLGDLSLIGRFSSSTNLNASSSGSSAGSNTKTDPSTSQRQKWMLSAEHVAMEIHAAVIAAELWCRIGQYALAKKECLCALRLYHPYCSCEQLIELVCRVVRISLRLNAYDTIEFIASPRKSAEAKAFYLRKGRAGVRVLRRLRDMLDSSSSPQTPIQRLNQCLVDCLMFTKSMMAIFDSNWKLAMKYLRIIAPDMSLSRDTFPDNKNLTPEDMEASLLYIYALSRCNVTVALVQCTRLISLTKQQNMIQFHIEATLLRDAISTKESQGYEDHFQALNKVLPLVIKNRNFKHVET